MVLPILILLIRIYKFISIKDINVFIVLGIVIIKLSIDWIDVIIIIVKEFLKWLNLV